MSCDLCGAGHTIAVMHIRTEATDLGAWPPEYLEMADVEIDYALCKVCLSKVAEQGGELAVRLEDDVDIDITFGDN